MALLLQEDPDRKAVLPDDEDAKERDLFVVRDAALLIDKIREKRAWTWIFYHTFMIVFWMFVGDIVNHSELIMWPLLFAIVLGWELPFGRFSDGKLWFIVRVVFKWAILAVMAAVVTSGAISSSKQLILANNVHDCAPFRAGVDECHAICKSMFVAAVAVCFKFPYPSELRRYDDFTEPKMLTKIDHLEGAFGSCMQVAKESYTRMSYVDYQPCHRDMVNCSAHIDANKKTPVEIGELMFSLETALQSTRLVVDMSLIHVAFIFAFFTLQVLANYGPARVRSNPHVYFLIAGTLWSVLLNICFCLDGVINVFPGKSWLRNYHEFALQSTMKLISGATVMAEVTTAATAITYFLFGFIELIVWLATFLWANPMLELVMGSFNCSLSDYRNYLAAMRQSWKLWTNLLP